MKKIIDFITQTAINFAVWFFIFLFNVWFYAFIGFYRLSEKLMNSTTLFKLQAASFKIIRKVGKTPEKIRVKTGLKLKD